MADKKIDLLPTLAAENLSPLSDYLIVQQSNGGTFKMTVSEFIAAYNFDGAGQILEVSNLSANNNGKIGRNSELAKEHWSIFSVEFHIDGLYNINSAWILNTVLTVRENGNYLTGGSDGTPAIGETFSDIQTKSSGIDLLGIYQLGGNHLIKTFTFTTTQTSHNRTSTRAITKYRLYADTSSEGLLRLDVLSTSSVYGSYHQITNNTPATLVDFSFALQGSTR